MKYVLKYLEQYKKESVLAPLFKMLEALFDLLVPLVTAAIINVGILNRDKTYIVGRCGLLVLLALVGLACSVTAQYFAAKAAVGCATGLRRALFSHIQSFSFTEMDTIGTSTLITRMTSDINTVQSGLNLALRLFLRSPFIVFGSMILAFTINVRAALVFVISIPILAVIVFCIMRVTAPLYKNQQGVLDRVMSITRENLTGVRVVRAFGKEKNEVERFETANGGFTQKQLFVGRISALMNPLTYVVVNLGIIAILNTGAVQIDGGVMLAGDVVALINYMSQILVELVKLANVIVQTSRAIASAGRVAAVMDTPSGMQFPKEASDFDWDGSKEEPKDAVCAVKFDHVSLTYADAGGESLTDINFSAGQGQTIGVIGGTGSGKSSLVSLIPRFYDATQGVVSLFGLPVQQWPQTALRKQVSVVMQRAQLFSGTIRSNLLWGNEQAGDMDLWQALEIAQAADFVRAKPKGLDDVVEQGGHNLSGGQRQRLTIARALVAHPRLLILDDSASALDYATDAALRRALQNLPWPVTVFLVSQRTSSLQQADRILVLDDGQLVGVGRHEELLKTCSTYREIYDSQFRKGGEVQ